MAERVYLYPCQDGYQVHCEYRVIRPQTWWEKGMGGGGCPSRGRLFTYEKAVEFAKKYIQHLKTGRPTEVILDLLNHYPLHGPNRNWPGVDLHEPIAVPQEAIDRATEIARQAERGEYGR